MGRRKQVEPASEVTNVSMDGTMVNIREGSWKEVKPVTVSAVRHPLDAKTGRAAAQLRDQRYLAGLWDATEFGKQQGAEACRRGMDNASYLSSFHDGAAWIWYIVRMCYGVFVEIIDWRHAVEKLWLVAQHRFDTESKEAANWVCAQNQRLIAGHLRTLLHHFRLFFPGVDPYLTSRHSLSLQ